MKRVTLLLILLVVAGVTGYFWYRDSNRDKPVDIDYPQFEGVEYVADVNDGLYIALFTEPLEFFYDPENMKSIKQVSEDNGFVVSVNGSYFTQSSTHAGLLIIDGDQKTLTAPDDNQVTHMVVINGDSVEILSAKTFDLDKYTDLGVTAFQTGPLIIENNEIQHKLITDSANGTGRHIRTLFGYTDSGTRFFVVTTRTYTLIQLAYNLLEQDIFKNQKITVVNLDGGSSSTMYSKHMDEFNITNYKILPIIIGAK